MKLAIMQPYFLPYLGYFQLIKAVDKFIFYDDVNFIKNGWINRNRIIINNSVKYLTVQLKGASPNILINEVSFTDNRLKLLKTIHMAYRKAPFYAQIMPVIESIMKYETQSISTLAIFSIQTVCSYLKLRTQFEISSIKYSDTKGMEKDMRIKLICKRNNASVYYNPIGGCEFYSKENFKKDDIDLFFLNPNFLKYKQFNNEFVHGLSILDIMMFNSIDEIYKMLDNYELT